MEIELRSTFETSLKEGVNIFLGAGFSIFSRDKNGNHLPLGYKLAEELTDKFPCPKINDLSKICTVIDSIDSGGLREYLDFRFDVQDYDKFYDGIIKINCRKIFTTNIDNLIYRIYDNTNLKYINNIFLNGSSYMDQKCIDYIPIHGSIDMPETKLLFSKQELASSFRTKLNAWLTLNNSAQQLPSLFLGYSLEDVGAIESLFGSPETTQLQKNKWILLYKPDEGTIAYFKALGFKIIIGDIKEFFKEIEKFDLNSSLKTHRKDKDSIEEIFPNSRVPKKNYKGQIRAIDQFFLGSAPIWSDILSNRIYQTSHLDNIINKINERSNLVVTGIPASGKSTLLLQVAKKISSSKRVLIFNDRGQ